MPLTHVVLDDERYSIEEAREVVASRDNSLRYTPELFEAMLATRQERDYISTTSLTAKCTRQQSIQRQYNYTEDLDGMWASFRGTMFHGQLEKNIVDPAIEEARFFIEVDGIELSGSPDVVTPDSGIVYDYKFCKEVPRWNKPWSDHVEQGNINRYLCDHAHKVHWRGWEITEDAPPVRIPGQTQPAGGVKALGRFTKPSAFRPIDWQDIVVVYMDDKGVKPLRCTKSIQIPKVDPTQGTKAAVVSDVWSDEQVEELIDVRFPKAYTALTLLTIPQAPEGWEHQGHVLCGYCGVRAECAALEREGK